MGLDFPYVFTRTVVGYPLLVLPSARSELAQWQRRANEIPNANLRRAAARALTKRGNMEGAALFATLVPAAGRRDVVRALVAFQTAYNYLDWLSECPSEDPIANGHRLHQALIAAVDPARPHGDYYARNHDRGDGGYLRGILDVCRDALAGLPSYAAVAPSLRAAAVRIVYFQALNLSEPQGGQGALGRWAADVTPAGSGLEWWETAAGAGSSLGVHALIAAAASPDLERGHADAIECLYFPWAGALHTLLDSLADHAEDRRRGQRSLLDYYRSPADAAAHLAELAARSVRASGRVADPHAHRVILTAMCSYYLTAPECDTAEGQAVARALACALGVPLKTAILMFRCRRLVYALARRVHP
ncbi:MAG TPA: DUF2600 family protein [Solirubrobacteraceae bacterium]|nr:DUF2600 family protein [Solirubrobacteraceae bacterium]